MPALEKVAAKGIPTVNIGYNFIDSPAVTSNAYVDQWKQSTQVATHLAESLKAKAPSSPCCRSPAPRRR